MNAQGLLQLFKNKTLRTVLVLIGALLLLFAVWKVFFQSGSSEAVGYQATEQETRLAQLLILIDGVDGAAVMITEEDGCAVSAVVIFSGTDGILTRLRITEVTASALNLTAADVIVYPSS